MEKSVKGWWWVSTMMVFALDAMTMGVLAANRAVITVSGAPKTSRARVNTVNRNARPGNKSEKATRRNASAPAIVCHRLDEPLPYSKMR